MHGYDIANPQAHKNIRDFYRRVGEDQSEEENWESRRIRWSGGGLDAFMP
jgi:hypothetical protein